MKYIVTGGLGFIGFNFIDTLHANDEILIVEDLDLICETKQKKLFYLFKKYKNINIIHFTDFPENSEDFIVVHFGAISNTRETDFKKLYDKNIKFTKKILKQKCKCFINSSSASVYGNNEDTSEDILINEDPLNLYALSKKIIDDFIRAEKFENPIYSLRYFNVYSFYDKFESETHKYSENQSSPHYKWTLQIEKNDCNTLELFEGSDKIYRDFISIERLLEVIHIFLRNRPQSGIYNIGMGLPKSFEEIALEIANKYININLNIIPFPGELKNNYQFYTKADTTKLKKVL